MNKQTRQFEHEKMWSQVFLDYLNQEKGTDYIPVKHDNKETPKLSDVDVKALSLSGKFPNLYLQLTRDSRYERTFKHKNYSAPVFNSDNIIIAISEKAEKYTKSKKDFSDIILLIQGTLSESSTPFVFTKELYQKSFKYPFKAIYYLSAPRLTNSDGVSHEEGWLIKDIKSLKV